MFSAVAPSSADKRSTTTSMAPATVAPRVMTDAPWSTASSLLEVPCPLSHPSKFHCYKMLIDPMIHQGAKKQVQYDGVLVPGNPHHHNSLCTDHRKKPIPSQRRVREELELPVPCLETDE